MINFDADNIIYNIHKFINNKEYEKIIDCVELLANNKNALKTHSPLQLERIIQKISEIIILINAQKVNVIDKIKKIKTGKVAVSFYCEL